MPSLRSVIWLPLVLASVTLGPRPTPAPILPPPDPYMRARVVMECEGPGSIADYANANYELRITERAESRVAMDISVRRTVESEAPYPVEALPDGLEAYLADRPDWIQAGHPLIVAQSSALVEGAATQAEALARIVAFVREHVAYTPVAARDAVRVLETGEGDCVGYGNLSLALLRAAGIPARAQTGIIWRLQGEIGQHLWIEVYHTDVGWVSIDPQMRITPRYILGCRGGNDVAIVFIRLNGWCC